MAITQNVPTPTSAPSAEAIARPESAGRLILIAIGWLLVTELMSGFPVGFVEGVLKRKLHTPNRRA
jgi:hypothetical protein